MNILLFIDSLASGGAQRQIVGLAKLLSDEKFKVSVLYYYDIPFYIQDLETHGIHHELLSKGHSKTHRFFSLYKILKLKKPDLVISYLDTPNIFVSICKLLGLNFKLIVSERNFSINKSQKVRLKFNLYRLADKVVPNSYSQMEFIVKNYGFLRNKIQTITNFVDLNIFTPASNKIKKNEVLNIIGIGRYIEQKNLLSLVKAMRIVKDKHLPVKISWYGNNFFQNGYPSAASAEFIRVSQLVKELGLEDCFILNGEIKDVQKLYRSSDLFILPSIFEGFPNVICEAMACGMPVLASNVCDNAVLVDNGVNGFLFSPDNSEQIANCISKFFELDLESQNRMRVKSREKAERICSSQIFVKKYIELIKII